MPRELKWSWEVRERLPDAGLNYELLNQLWDRISIVLPFHHGNQTNCTRYRDRSQSASPASSLHLHKRPKRGGGIWASVLAVSAPVGERSFFNGSSHHFRKSMRKVSFVTNLVGLAFRNPTFFMFSLKHRLDWFLTLHLSGLNPSAKWTFILFYSLRYWLVSVKRCQGVQYLGSSSPVSRRGVPGRDQRGRCAVSSPRRWVSPFGPDPSRGPDSGSLGWPLLGLNIYAWFCLRESTGFIWWAITLLGL